MVRKVMVVGLSLIISVIGAFLLTGCIIPSTQVVPNPETPRELSAGDSDPVIEIFFDGTKNKWDSRTNVRRRFELIAAREDPNHKCFYVDGVGNESAIAAALGIGMKDRVLEGYKFLSCNWQEGTNIRIFGFSRGSLQARMLAGMMAHSGLPAGKGMDKKRVGEIADEVWKFSSEKLRDSDVDPESPHAVSCWKKVLEENCRKTQDHIWGKFGSDIKFVYPDIEFMGIWDTVPGLTLTELKGNGDLKHAGGTRYKVRPYPNIRVIAHALALDERRNKFSPLLVGGPLDPSKTIVHEVWFPGAHSDIGGGYSDSNDLAGITFNWVHSILFDHGISKTETNAYSDATGILHHPEAGKFYEFVGGKQRRVIPANSLIDRTVFIRAARSPAPEEVGSGQENFPYEPVLTVDLGNGTTETVKIEKTYDPVKLLGKHLVINDSRLNANNQKTVTRVIRPEAMQLQVEKSSEPPVVKPVEEKPVPAIQP